MWKELFIAAIAATLNVKTVYGEGLYSNIPIWPHMMFSYA